MSESNDTATAQAETTPAAPDLSDGNCMVCRKPATHPPHKCKKCSFLTYCRTHCRSKTPAEYNDAILEKKLERVASILKKTYLTFRENAWCSLLRKVEDKGDRLVMTMEFGVNDPAHFVRFPSHLLPPGEHVKAGILMSTRCDEALARTHFLSVKLLQNLSDDISICEVSLNLRAVPLTVHTISTDRKQKLSNWPAVKHTVLAIQSLQTDKEWIIDITGAQYGISSPPHRWDEYEASHVKHVIQTFAHGYNEMLIGELAKIKGNPMMQCSLLIKVSNVMEQAVVAWESQHGQVHSLVVLPEADFVVQKQSLLVTMDTAARNFIAATDFSADTRTAEKYEQGHPMASLKEAQEMLVRIRESHAL